MLKRVIKSFVETTQVIEQVAQMSYVEQLKARLVDIDSKFLRLDESFRSGKIDAEAYAEQRYKLKQTRIVLQDELHGMGVV